MKEKVLRDLILTVILYSAAFIAPEALTDSRTRALCVVAWVLFPLTIVLLAAARHGDMAKTYGLSCSWRDAPYVAKASFPFGVVLIVPCANLVAGWTEPWVFNSAFFIVLTCAAVIEELCFRGYLLGLFLLQGWKPLRAVVVISVAFACLHLFNIGTAGIVYAGAQFVAAGCLGAAFGFIRLYTNSIYPCIVAHALINATSCNALLYDSDGLWLVCAAAIVASAWSYFWWKRHPRCERYEGIEDGAVH